MQINGFVWDLAVSYLRGVNVPETSESSTVGPRHPFQIALVVVLAIEAAGLAAATVFLVLEILIAPADSIASAIALAVVAGLATAWVVAMSVGAWRGQSWVRGAAIVVQVLLGAVAIGSFQGLVPRPDIGWILLIPAIVVVFLIFSKPVQAALRRRDGSN